MEVTQPFTWKIFFFNFVIKNIEVLDLYSWSVRKPKSLLCCLVVASIVTVMIDGKGNAGFRACGVLGLVLSTLCASCHLCSTTVLKVYVWLPLLNSCEHWCREDKELAQVTQHRQHENCRAGIWLWVRYKTAPHTPSCSSCHLAHSRADASTQRSTPGHWFICALATFLASRESLTSPFFLLFHGFLFPFLLCFVYPVSLFNGTLFKGKNSFT